MASPIDASLIEPRRIVRWSENESWFVCDLECGHTVWSALEPPISMHCGACLERLIGQIREIQAAQRAE
jgi:hypothetical protein